MTLQFAVLYGSVRETRQGIKAARFIDAQLRRARPCDHAGRPAGVPPAAARQDVQGIPQGHRTRAHGAAGRRSIARSTGS